jgi:tetratricopeptide (TPR) repeat protein
MMATQAYKKGGAAHRFKDYDAAIIHYNHAIRLDPNHAIAYNDRGLAKSALNDKKAAIDDYNHAIRLDPNYANAYNNRGNAKSALNDKKGAIDDYNHAIRLDRNYAVAYNNRGLAKSALNDKKAAIDDYNHAIRLDPNYANAYNNRGNAKSDLDDEKGANDDYNHAIRLNPNHADAYLNRGLAKSVLNDKKGAIDDYNHAIRLNPNDADAYYNRGEAKDALNDQKGAIDDYTHAIRLNPNDAGAYYNRGRAKRALNDQKGAIDDYNHAIRLNPNHANAYYNRGNAKSALNDKKGGIDDYNHAIRLNPNYAYAYNNRALAKFALDDKKGAVDDYNHAIRLDPNRATLSYNREIAEYAQHNSITSDTASLVDSVVSSTVTEIASASDAKLQVTAASDAAHIVSALATLESKMATHAKIAATLERGAGLSPALLTQLQNEDSALTALIARHKQDLTAEQQRAYIASAPQLFEFFFVLQSCVNASFTCAQSLLAGYTEMKDSAGAARGMGTASRAVSYVSKALQKIGDHTPLVGPLVKLIGSVVGAGSRANAYVRIRRIASCGASVASVNACMEHVSRLLCLHLHSELLALPASASAAGLRARFNSARGDAYVGKCAELAKKYSSTLLGDMMCDSSDSKKQIAGTLDGSASCVCSVLSLLLRRRVDDFSLPPEVQLCIDKHTASTLPASARQSFESFSPSFVVASDSKTSHAGAVGHYYTHATGPASTVTVPAGSYADAAAFEALKADMVKMQRRLDRRESMQQDSDDEDEDCAVSVGRGSQQQAMMSAKSKKRQHKPNQAESDDEVAALRKQLELMQARFAHMEAHVHGITQNIADVAVAANVEQVFDTASRTPSHLTAAAAPAGSSSRDALFHTGDKR